MTKSGDVSSDIDGAIFFKEGYYYWYDLKKHVLHCMRSNLNMSSFNEAILFSGDSILIKEGCEIKKYKERDFSQKIRLHSKQELLDKDFLESSDVILFIKHEHSLLVVYGVNGSERNRARAICY